MKAEHSNANFPVAALLATRGGLLRVDVLLLGLSKLGFAGTQPSRARDRDG